MDRRRFILTGSAAVAAPFVARGAGAFLRDGRENVSSEQLPLLFGADYYPDQTPEHLWEEDARRMSAMGITNVRVAEFAWALMEPSEGRFDFAWLDRSIGILHGHGIAVLLGTPSAAPPPWLVEKYPEILEVNDHGETLSPGARRFTCPTNPTYRRLSLTIATEMAKHFAATPGVIGWQIDNEFTLGSSGRCYCKYCRAGFQTWLKEQYHTLDALNETWGTVFWSNTYSDFLQIPVPLPSGAPPNPGHALDYDRYQSYANVSFMNEQLLMLRKQCPQHFITTNNVCLVDTINMRDLYRDLDFVAADNYPGFMAIYSEAPLTSEMVAPMISYSHDFSRSVKDGKPFLIMEEQTGKAGQPIFSPQPEPGQLRLWSYQAVAHGAMGINYFRWDTADFGAEEYWHGLLRHDRSKSRGFDEIQRTMAELKALGREALEAKYDAALALVYDNDSAWALAIQPGQPKLKYAGEMVPWYGAMAASHAGVDIVGATKDLSQYKVVCAPVMYIVKPEQAERIRAYVQGGGTFIAGFRLGVKDEHSRIVATPLPGLLRDVMGVELIDYQPIYSEKQMVDFKGPLAGANTECHVWADILDPKTADVLATYTGGAYEGKAAITSNSFGKGKAIYLGAHLEPAELARVLLTLMAQAGVPRTIEAPSGVEVTTRRAGDRAWTYVLNHTTKEQSVTLPGAYVDVRDKSPVSGSVRLEAYGARVLLKG